MIHRRLAMLVLLCGLGVAAQTIRAGAMLQSTPSPSLQRERLRGYHELLVRTVAVLPAQGSLAALVSPMLAGPATDSSVSPADDNRLALIATTFYINSWPLDRLIPEARDWPRAPRRRIVLRGRHDLAQHFIVSATVAAFAGTPIADAVGVYKELEDTRARSGFSFSDLAADRAGAAFGRLATESPESMQRLRERMSAGVRDGDLIPPVVGLPDNLPQAEFIRRFGGVGAPAYNEMLEEIDRRIADLPLFQ